MLKLHKFFHRFGLQPGDTVFFFTDGIPPDGRPHAVISTYNVALVVVFYVLALAGIVFAIVCLLFNWIFRKSK